MAATAQTDLFGNLMYRQNISEAKNIAGKNQSAPTLQRNVSILRSPSFSETLPSAKCL